jgi:hypothetical protein
MKRLALIMLSIFLTIENSYGENLAPIVKTNTTDKVLFIEKGTEAPFKGYLFSEERTLEIRQELIELDSLRSIEPSYQKSIDIYKKNQDIYDYKVNVLLNENEKLARAVSVNRYDGYIGFGIGILVTSLAIYGAKQIIK